MSNYLKIEIEISSQDEAEILIAELSETGFYAFEQEENQLFAYIKEGDFKEEQLQEVLPDGKDFEKTSITEENWNQQWESDFQPVVINDFAAIRAHFHKPIKNVEHDIIITPKMSFGTGHHATTFLMIKLMQQIDFENKKVLDFGTGTGVLAILAEKLGAIDVLAIDNDIWSINNAKENTEMNHCENIFPEQKDVLEGIAPVDVLLANINLNVLTDAANGISNAVKNGGWFLCSGFLRKDEEEMDAYFKNNFEKKFVSEREGWLAILFQKVT